MSEPGVAARVTLHWVTVTDEHGRVRLEMCWTDPANAPAATAAPALASPPAASHAASHAASRAASRAA